MAQGEPWRHHYIPEFYLRRWAGPDGRVTKFFRTPKGEVKALRRHPRATGFVPNLYAMETRNGPAAQAVETEFLQPVHTKAAEALQILEEGKDRWTDDTRSAWSRFIISLISRTPRDILALKRYLVENFHKGVTPEQDEFYLRERKPDDPLTLVEYLKRLDPKSLEESALKIFAQMHNNSIGQTINNLQWFVIDAKVYGRRFITSDQPVFIVPLERDDGLISMPIGPTRAFVALKNPARIRSILGGDREALVKKLNRQTAARALDFAWGADDSILPFVRRNFGVDKGQTFVEVLAHQMAAADDAEMQRQAEQPV